MALRIHDGTYRWQHLKAEPSHRGEKEGTRWCLLGVHVDERFRAQEALQASEREAREILDRVPAMISIRTEEGVAYTNNAIDATQDINRRPFLRIRSRNLKGG